MQENKTFKGMQNENTVLKQDYENLMKDFVAACKSEREANDMLRAFVGKFMMPIFESEYRPEFPLHAMRSEVIGDENVRPQSDNSLCTESGIFWYTHYKNACEQLKKLQQQNGFAMGDLKAEIEFRQKAEAENLVLKGKIDALEAQLVNKGEQIVKWYDASVKLEKELENCKKLSWGGVFVIYECGGGVQKPVGWYAIQSEAEDFAQRMADKNEKIYKVFSQVAVFEKSKHSSDASQAEQDSDNSEAYYIVYEREKSGEMSSIGGLTDIAEAEKLAKDSHESEPDKSHYVFKKVLVLTPETNKK